jgi:hypothetical protein
MRSRNQIKIVFLDVDGVLNHDAAMKAGDQLDSECILRLRRITKEVDLVVLSSAWRMGGEGAYHVQMLRYALRAYGIEIHSMTPKLPGEVRGEEIAVWMTENRIEIDKDKILILDDDADFLWWQKDFLVQTSFETGLTDEHVERALEILR